MNLITSESSSESMASRTGRWIGVLLVVVALVSCETQTVVGNYFDANGASLELHSSGSFTYVISGHLGAVTAVGTWHARDNLIVLEGDSTHWSGAKIGAIEIDPESAEVVLDFSDASGVRWCCARVAVRDSVHVPYSADGRIVIASPIGGKLHITGLGLESSSITVPPMPGGRVDIVVQEIVDNYIFKADTLVVRGRDLHGTTGVLRKIRSRP